MAEIRKATTRWEGDLASGSGRVSAETSGLFRDLPVSWASRTESASGRTSPEELLAAAHASCFSMAFSARLAKNGTPPRSLEVTAAVTFDKVGAGWGITASALSVTADVPGIEAAKLGEIAEDAKGNCPVSKALAESVKLSVEARLAGRSS